MKTRKKDDIDGMLEDIAENLNGISKSELVNWIMELHFFSMEESDLREDYENFYGNIE